VSTAQPHPLRARLRRLILPGLLLILLAASLTANVRLYQQADDFYRRLCDLSLDPYGLKHAEYPADQPPGVAPGLPVVLFFGDSRSLAWPAPPVAGLRYVHRALGGQTSEQVRGRFDANVTPLSPRFMILQAGIGDLKTIALFPQRRGQIVSECEANLHEIVKRATDAGTIVIVSTIFPTGKVPLERKLEWSQDVPRAVEEVNSDLRGLASDKVIVFDAWKILEDHGQFREGYGLDTLHLTPAGYEALNTELVRILRPLSAQKR
jgi:lysophospholipase L1-like esterase